MKTVIQIILVLFSSLLLTSCDDEMKPKEIEALVNQHLKAGDSHQKIEQFLDQNKWGV